MFVVGDVEPGVEGLVRESAVAVVGVLVGVVCVGEQPQGVVEERTPSRVVLVMLGQAAVDVRESGPDAVLVPFQGGQVDRVGEVRGEELVAFGFQASPVCGEVGEVGLGGAAGVGGEVQQHP